MNKGIVLVIILAMTVFLSGCGGQQTSTGATFIGGTEGLKLSFIEGSPPDTIIDGGTNEFGVLLKVENVGESSIKVGEGYAQIWGMDAGAYNVDTKYPNFKVPFDETNGFAPELRGAKMSADGSVLDGGITTVDFVGLKYMGTIPGVSPQTVQANVCYKYNTKMAAQICAKSTTEQALTNKDICDVEGEKNPQNSGGPLQITSLKETYVGEGKVSLVLTLSHVGSGEAFFKDNAVDCRNAESNNDKNKVWLGFKSVVIGGKEETVTCSSWEEPGSRTFTEGTESQTYNGGYVRMYKDGSGKETGTVSCTVETPSSTVVQVPVEAVLGYTYLQTVQKEIQIRHVAK